MSELREEPNSGDTQNGSTKCYNASPIGETVLTEEEIYNLWRDAIESGESKNVLKWAVKAQDAHTRSVIADELTKMGVSYWLSKINMNVQMQFDALIKRLEG